MEAIGYLASSIGAMWLLAAAVILGRLWWRKRQAVQKRESFEEEDGWRGP